MCKLSNLYVLDLWDNDGAGGITFNVANSLPQLMNQPCKIVVKQVQSELVDSTATFPISIDNLIYFRVVHNMNVQSGTNLNGFSNSNILCLFDTYKGRKTFDLDGNLTGHVTGTTQSECTLFAPNGLPNILTLQRWGALNQVAIQDIRRDSATLSFLVRLEITVNPDQG
jgi:hypothetical protein